MSQLTDKARQLSQAADELVKLNEQMDNSHDNFNTAVQEYKDMLAAQVGPEKAAQVAPSTIPTMEGQS